VIQIEKALLQVAFDVAVNSMDFGSGFLCAEEVDALRAIAVLLGVDPMLGTPSNQRCRFTGEHRYRITDYTRVPPVKHCPCGKYEPNPEESAP